MKLALIGGTGIIGAALSSLATNAGASVIALSHDSPMENIVPNVRQIIVNRRDRLEFGEVAKRLQREYESLDVLVDIVPFGSGDAQQVLEYFAPFVHHIIVISTTLVYARHPSEPAAIPANHALTQPGLLGGYVDRKLEVEQVWRESNRYNWTIIRPYHVLGAGSLLGCLPFHNRDPELIRRLASHEHLALCCGGKIEMSYIHPADLAELIMGIAGKLESFGRAFNAVHPETIQALSYYREIANALHLPLHVQSISRQQVWDSDYGWELTTLPHIYEASDLYDIAGFRPSRDINQCIVDAVANCPAKLPAGQIPEVGRRIKELPRPSPIQWIITQQERTE